MKDQAMDLRDKITVMALRSIVRAAWAIDGAGERLRAAGASVEDGACLLAAERGIDVMDVLQPFLEAHSAPLDT